MGITIEMTDDHPLRQLTDLILQQIASHPLGIFPGTPSAYVDIALIHALFMTVAAPEWVADVFRYIAGDPAEYEALLASSRTWAAEHPVPKREVAAG